MNKHNLTFGPVNSRRFGISLGIDLSPSLKQCNFDCLYCELQSSKTTTSQKVSYNVDNYINAVQISLDKYPEIDVITITANGEPTLYPYLNELVDKLNAIKADKKLLILSNSALINDQKIRNILQKIDIVKLSLDCVSQDCFNKLDKPNTGIRIDDIINGLFKFKEMHNKALIIETLFVDKLNNNENEVRLLINTLSKLNPTRLDIGTIDRPPAYNVKPLNSDELYRIANLFNTLNVSIMYKNYTPLNKYLSSCEILNLLDKRPQTIEDIDNLLNTKSKDIFDTLLEDNKIIKVDQSGVIFYRKNITKIAICILSGGMDSALSSYIAKQDGYDIITVHFNYGQRTQQKELQAFRDISKALGVKNKYEIDLPFFTTIGASALTDNNIEVPVTGVEDGIPSTYVPFRNGIFLSIATAIAEKEQASALYIGVVQEDSSGYPDCSDVFISKMKNAMNQGTKQDIPIDIITPLIHKTKAEIVSLSYKLNMPLELTWSCYQNSTKACGVCDSCRLRLKGFKMANKQDKIEYEINV